MKKRIFHAGVFLCLISSLGLLGFGAKSEVALYYLGVITKGYPAQIIRTELAAARIKVLEIEGTMILFEVSGKTHLTPYLKKMPFLKKLYRDVKDVMKDAAIKDQKIARRFLSLAARNKMTMRMIEQAVLGLQEKAGARALLQTDKKTAENEKETRRQLASLRTLRATDRIIRAKFKPKHRPGATVLQEDDPYEPNNTMDTAATMAPGTYANLQCLDDDWYKVNVAAGQDLMVTINLDSSKGDLSLQLYDSTGNYLDGAFGSDTETVCYANCPAGWYYISVYYYLDPNSYNMEINVGNLLGDISGRVTDENGNGIPDVSVSVTDTEGYSINSATTSASGDYVVGAIPPGDCKIYFGTYNAGNYIAEYYNDKQTFEEADVVLATAGQTTTGIDAQLATGGSISGRVTDSSSNGIQGVWVYTYGLSGYAWESAVTDSDGNYTVIRLSTDNYKVNFDAYYTEFLDEWYNKKDSMATADAVSVEVGQETSGINAQLTLGGKISGRVSDTKGNGINGVFIYAYDLDGNGISESETDYINGTYTVSRLPGGNYKVYFDTEYAGNFVSEWYNHKTGFGSADKVAVTLGQTTPGINAQLRQGGQLDGYVMDEDYYGLDYVDIYIVDLNREIIREDYSNYGSFYIEGLPSGKFKVYFDPWYAGNYVAEWYEDKQTFETADKVSVITNEWTYIEAVLATGGTILGRVTNGSGTGLSSADVEVYDLDNNYQGFGWPDEDGYYTVEGLATGSYKAYFYTSGEQDYVSEWYNDKKTFDSANPVNVTAGKMTFGIDAELAQGGAISGRVTDSEDNGVKDVYVTIYDPDFNRVSYDWTDNNGEYICHGVPAGNGKVHFATWRSGDFNPEWYNDKTSFSTADAVGVVAGQTTSGINAQLSQGGSISGKVTNSKGDGIADVIILVYDLADKTNWISGWLTNGNGVYKVQGIPTGSYKIFFDTEYIEGYHSEWYNNKTTYETADEVSVTTGETTTGIDAELEALSSFFITNPTGATTWIKGQTGLITWSSSGAASGVNISLYRSSTKVRDIAPGTANDGTESWSVPTDLANGTDYHIVLEDVLDPDTVSFSEAFTIGLTATLNPPVLYSPLDAATDQSASLALQWIDSNTTPQETKYQVRLKPKGGGYVTFNTAKDATSYMVTLNKAKKTYSWNVRAFGSGANIKNSGWANGGVDWSFTTQGVVTLAAPNLRSPTNAAIGQPSSLNLEWDDTNSETQELKYQIRIKKTGGGYSYHSTSQDATGYIVSLLPTKTYFWNVRAVGNGTNILSSAWANGGADWAFTTAAPATLNPPVLISPADNATDQPTTIVFQWQDTNSSLEEVAYKIRLKPAGGAYIYFNTARDASSYTKSGLLKNKAYYWNVQAKGDGKGILSSAWANAGVDWKFTTKK